MPSDNDHVESGAQIDVPSMAIPSSVQPSAPIYHHVISLNFPLPSPMKCHGDVTGNWDFFKQQWGDYETATGLDKREESVCLATLRSSMGRECLQILLNLNLPEEDKRKIDKCLEALESYFKPSRNLVYERYVFNSCVLKREESVQSCHTSEKISRVLRIRCTNRWAYQGQARHWRKESRWQGETLERKILGLKESPHVR